MEGITNELPTKNDSSTKNDIRHAQPGDHVRDSNTQVFSDALQGTSRSLLSCLSPPDNLYIMRCLLCAKSDSISVP